jgi:ribose 5-phosphate isomerase A
MLPAVSLHPERPVDPATCAALEHVADGQTLGLGTGRAAEAFVHGLGGLVAQGFSVRGVPTSERTAALARGLDIPLVTLAEAGEIDVTFDGADEFDPNLDVIKGYGGALVREKIVAASSRKLVILVGPEKRVHVLGARGKLPVEVLPFGEVLATRRLRELHCEPTRRQGEDGAPYVTDNGNYILDCKLAPIARPAELEASILAIPGVLGTGLFLGMADFVIVNHGDAAEVLERKR